MSQPSEHDKLGPENGKLTPAVIKRICDALRMTAPYELAAMYGGISYQTLRNWIKKGEAGEEPYAAFVAEFRQAEAAAAISNLAKIEKAANDGFWTAAAWKLERRYPHLFGRQAIEITGRDGQPIETESTQKIVRVYLPKRDDDESNDSTEQGSEP